jgi:archaellum component FlaC
MNREKENVLWALRVLKAYLNSDSNSKLKPYLENYEKYISGIKEFVERMKKYLAEPIDKNFLSYLESIRETVGATNINMRKIISGELDSHVYRAVDRYISRELPKNVLIDIQKKVRVLAKKIKKLESEHEKLSKYVEYITNKVKVVRTHHWDDELIKYFIEHE